MHDVRAMTGPGTARDADDVASAEALAAGHVHPAQVGVAAAKATGVVDGDVQATGDPAGEGDDAVGRGPHRRARRDPVVDAPVPRAPGSGRRLEGTVDGTVDGGNQGEGSGEGETDHFHTSKARRIGGGRRGERRNEG